MRLDATRRQRRPSRAGIGEPLGLTPARPPGASTRVANAEMERAMRIVSVERGRDPRDFALVAFGGAGPAARRRLARDAGRARDHRAAGAGVGSAHRHAPRRTRSSSSPDAPRSSCDAAPSGRSRTSSQLDARVLADLGAHGRRRPAIRRTACLRYAGQGYESRRPAGVHGAAPATWRIAAAFEAAYQSGVRLSRAERSSRR